MLLQVKENKHGLSAIIGYILIITISIIMSIIVYQWLRTYVPRGSIECSDGTSIFIKSVNYDCTNSMLYLTVKNNGKFSINGYFIHVSNKSGEELATIDLSQKVTGGGIASGSSITFSDTQKNYLAPEETYTSSFNVAGYGRLYKIEIIPTRIQEIDNKNRLVSCSDAKVEEDLACEV